MLAGLHLALLVSVALGFFPGLADPYLPARTGLLLILSAVLCAVFAFGRVLQQRLHAASLLCLGLTLWCGLQFAFDGLRSGAGSTSMGLSRDAVLALLSFLSLHLIRSRPQFLQQFAWLNTLLAIGVSQLGLLQLAGFGLPWFPAAADGLTQLNGINMVAQYLGFSLALVIFLLAEENRHPAKTLLILAAGSLLAYPLLIACRSVLIGVCLLLAVAILWRRLQAWEALSMVAATALCAFCVARPVAMPAAVDGPRYHWVNSASKTTEAALLNVKFSSFQDRRLLWQQTLRMIADRPWLGFGRGSFEQASSSYVLRQPSAFRSEQLVTESPRNEVLLLLSELGLPLGGGLLIGLGGLLFRAWVHGRRQPSQHRRLELAGLLGIIFAAEALLQFPLFLPVGIFFGSLILGLLFSLLPEPSWKIPPQGLLRGAFALLAVLLVVQTGRLAYAESALARVRPQPEQLTRACRWLPEHWQVCLRYSYMLMDQGHWQELAQFNSQRLQRYPEFHPMERVAALSAWGQGRRDDACVLAQRYQKRFQGQSSLRFITRQCPEAKPEQGTRLL